MRTGLVTDPLFERHDTGPDHPERPARLAAISRRIKDLPLREIPARDATTDELAAAHAPAYIETVRDRILGGTRSLDPDTAVCPESYAAAVRAAGAALALGEAWLRGGVEAGFAAVRPPGHHACHARAMGFCIFNNAAILARRLHAEGKRVCIVDWDVHHGNGTQDILWSDAAIGYLSLHQSPLYPGTGHAHETGRGNIQNLPLPAGCGDREYLRAFEEHVLPWVEERAPDVIVVSAGFDAHRDDPLAGMQLSSAVYGEFTRLLLPRPILSVLEGGYDLEALAASVRAHLEALLAAP